MPCPECPEGIMRDRIIDGAETEICDVCGYPQEDNVSREYGQEALPLGTGEEQRVLFG